MLYNLSLISDCGGAQLRVHQLAVFLLIMDLDYLFVLLRQIITRKNLHS
jgi:hypothetical protein